MAYTQNDDDDVEGIVRQIMADAPPPLNYYLGAVPLTQDHHSARRATDAAMAGIGLLFTVAEEGGEVREDCGEAHDNIGYFATVMPSVSAMELALHILTTLPQDRRDFVQALMAGEVDHDMVAQVQGWFDAEGVEMRSPQVRNGPMSPVYASDEADAVGVDDELGDQFLGLVNGLVDNAGSNMGDGDDATP